MPSPNEFPPPGIILLCILGLIFGLFGFIPIFALIEKGGIFTALGAVALAVNVASLVVIYGLLKLKSWAWMGALVMYGFNTVLQFLQLNSVGVIVGLLVMYYVYGKEELYR